MIRNRGMLILGGILIAAGILFFLGAIFHIDLWALCCPVTLILIGVMVAFRPSLSGVGGPSNVMILGDIKRKGDWQVVDGEYWLGIGEIHFDMTAAQIVEGVTSLHIYGFIENVRFRLPADVGISIQASGMISNGQVGKHKIENIFAPFEYQSENYEQATRKIRVEMVGFIIEVKVD